MCPIRNDFKELAVFKWGLSRQICGHLGSVREQIQSRMNEIHHQVLSEGPRKQNPEIITDGTFCITDGTACLEAKLQKVAGNKTEFWSLGSSIDQAWKLIVEMVVWNEDVE